MDNVSDEWYVSFKEFKEEETRIYIFFISFLVSPCVISYIELPILIVVD